MMTTSIVNDEHGLRLERKYGSVLTVLEGHELSRLIRRFFWHYDRLAKNSTRDGEAFVKAVFAAYRGLYGPDAVYDEELRDLSTPDARKIDFFYRGLLSLAAENIDNESTEGASIKKSLLAAVNDVLVLRPSLFGIGLDLNALIRKAIKTRNSDH